MIYSYRRVSTSSQDLGLDVQDARVKAWVGERQYTDFVDEGVSGSIPLSERPGGASLLAALQPGDTVVVAKLDRLFRSMVDTVTTMADWDKQGIILVSMHENIDFSTPWGRAVCHIISAIAELERSMIRERTKAAFQVKKARGHKIGGRAYGWRIRCGKEIPVEDEQVVLREIKDCYDAGMRQRAIAERLNSKGVPPPRGGVKWRQPQIAKLLKSFVSRQSAMV